jgi:hypothetical protein
MLASCHALLGAPAVALNLFEYIPLLIFIAMLEPEVAQVAPTLALAARCPEECFALLTAKVLPAAGNGLWQGPEFLVSCG